MRYFKLLVMGGIVLALSLPAWGVSIPFREAWNGPVYMHLVNYDDSRLYDWNGGFLADNVTPIVQGTSYAAGLVKSTAGIATRAGEDAWGIFSIDQILTAEVTGANNITPISPNDILFSSGDSGIEVVGIFSGGHDLTVAFTDTASGALGEQKIISAGYDIKFYTQPVGTYNGGGPAGGPGASTRLASGDYPTVGFDAAGNSILGSELVLALASQPGIETYEFRATFAPDGGGSGNGQFNFYASVTGGSMAVIFDTDIFPVLATPFLPGTTADMRFKGSSDPTNKDWLVHSSDPATTGVVPEPITMAGLLLGVGCLGRYIRKRR